MTVGYYREAIRQAGSSLALDESIRILCPYCHGGRSQEKSLSITRRIGGLMWVCFRASCGKSGLIGESYTPKTSVKPLRARFSGDLLPIPTPLYDLSILSLSAQGIRYIGNSVQRLYFPIWDYRGYQIGELLKATRKDQKPKALINKFNDVPLLHFPLGQELKDSICLVEDQISSIKVSRVTTCAALMGTNLSQEGLMLLKRLGIRSITLMLDGDIPGIKAANKIKDKARPFFSVRTVIPPENKDPKDFSIQQIKEMLR